MSLVMLYSHHLTAAFEQYVHMSKSHTLLFIIGIKTCFRCSEYNCVSAHTRLYVMYKNVARFVSSYHL